MTLTWYTAPKNRSATAKPMCPMAALHRAQALRGGGGGRQPCRLLADLEGMCLVQPAPWTVGGPWGCCGRPAPMPVAQGCPWGTSILVLCPDEGRKMPRTQVLCWSPDSVGSDRSPRMRMYSTAPPYHCTVNLPQTPTHTHTEPVSHTWENL